MGRKQGPYPKGLVSFIREFRLYSEGSGEQADHEQWQVVEGGWGRRKEIGTDLS